MGLLGVSFPITFERDLLSPIILSTPTFVAMQSLPMLSKTSVMTGVINLAIK